ncbi:MAG TPA: MoxR family ATPase [Steroidobacteraceae bacterium]|jgi:MoxR-like ATPase|nr:MoxR family ATPase [Steroidobacteraceae bacterium]
MLNYQKAYFDPASLPGFSKVPDAAGRDDWAYDAGENVEASRRHFVFAEEAVLALNVALATRRPLLVSGEAGSGKTSLARFASAALGRVFYRETVTSRTLASDLLSSFDALQRLSHAQIKDKLLQPQAYVVPGKLWWAISPASAAQRGLKALGGQVALTDPGIYPEKEAKRATLLLDEIDKADPDVPNDLLESLDERSFTVPETGDRIEPEREDVLIILTTNGERELPPAFLRRCLTIELPKPDKRWLIEVAERQFGGGKGPFKGDLYDRLAQEVMDLRAIASEQGRRPPSTSEFVDAVTTCRKLLDEEWVGRDNAQLRSLLDVVLAKGVRS